MESTRTRERDAIVRSTARMSALRSETKRRRRPDAIALSVMVLLCLVWGVGHVAAKLGGLRLALRP